MRALEVAVFLNNASTEEAVRSDAIACERGEMAKKMTDMEAEPAALKKGASEKDEMIAFLKGKAESGFCCQHELEEVRAKFVVEKKVLENALLDASQPVEDETEDTAVLARPTLVYKLEELERNIVGAARHGFENAIGQLKVLNPSVWFRMDGAHFLKYVRNGEIVDQDDDGHV
jgi:hypothetical protein